MSDRTPPAGVRRGGRSAPRVPEWTRAALVAATLEVMAESGDAAVRVGEIARRAQVTTGALYAHFASREDLIAAAHIEYMRRAVAAMIERRDEQVGSSDLDDAGVARVNQYTEHLMTSEGLAERRRWAEAAIAGHRSPELLEELRDVTTPLLEHGKAVIEDSQKRGIVDPALDPNALATLQFALSIGMSLFGDLFDDDQVHKDALLAAWRRVPVAFAPPTQSNSES